MRRVRFRRNFIEQKECGFWSWTYLGSNPNSNINLQVFPNRKWWFSLLCLFVNTVLLNIAVLIHCILHVVVAYFLWLIGHYKSRIE